MKKNGYIYALVDPRDKRIRYVGQTVNLEQRYNSHCERFDSTRKSEWVKELSLAGVHPQMITLQIDVPVNDMDYAEKWWISVGYKNGWNLLNVAQPTKKSVNFEDIFSDSLLHIYRQYVQDADVLFVVSRSRLALFLSMFVGVAFAVLTSIDLNDYLYSYISGLVLAITLFFVYRRSATSIK